MHFYYTVHTTLWPVCCFVQVQSYFRALVVFPAEACVSRRLTTITSTFNSNLKVVFPLSGSPRKIISSYLTEFRSVTVIWIYGFMTNTSKSNTGNHRFNFKQINKIMFTCRTDKLNNHYTSEVKKYVLSSSMWLFSLSVKYILLSC